ncbi:MAG: Phosphate binding protein [Verrucomicrobiales bacterium]|nr:Phosphate binding protein [Verrucomicrobiales bacterium]MDB6129192.1 Phosphate binding protein [Verrucomicrobiales bacterium]
MGVIGKSGSFMKNSLKKLTVILTLAACALSAQAGKITIKGSDTLLTLAQKWAEIYMGAHSETKISVLGGGSGIGFAALQGQQTDLANASRKIKSTEIEACIKAFGKRPTEYKVCLDGLTVYVNQENPVKELTLEQLEGIFTGKIKNWKEVGGNDAAITVYSRENSSGTYEFFKEHVLKGKDFVASAQTMQGTSQVVQGVENDAKAIGYGGASYAAKTRALGIKKDSSSPAIAPTEENVVKGTYPIWRYLFVYVNPSQDKGEIASYLTWIRSDEGQKVVKQEGYYPLPEALRK